MLKAIIVLLLTVLAVHGAEDIACAICGGKGLIPCAEKTCVAGQVLCPGKCLKKEVGRWEKMKVAGHPDDELWQKVYGKGTWHAWTQAHIGEVIDVKNGDPTNVGKCPQCHGTTRVTCAKCAGKGEIPCTVCAGTGKTTQAKIDTYQRERAAKLYPDHIKLKNGDDIACKLVAETADKVMYQIDKRMLEVAKDQVETIQRGGRP